jgi:hypothetical protein
MSITHINETKKSTVSRYICTFYCYIFSSEDPPCICIFVMKQISWYVSSTVQQRLTDFIKLRMIRAGRVLVELKKGENVSSAWDRLPNAKSIDNINVTLLRFCSNTAWMLGCITYVY